MSTVPNIPARDVLERALRVLDERGWHQGSMYGLDGSICAVGAVRLAEDELMLERECPMHDVPSADALSALKHVIDFNWGSFEPQIFIWNDSASTTVEDVKLAFKRAIEACDD